MSVRAGLSLALALLGAAAPPAAAQWALGAPGRTWVKTTLFVQVADEQYQPDGSTLPWFADGRSTAVALFTEAIVGITDRLDAWVQVPYFDFEFTDAARTLREAGIGDVRAWLRYEVARFADRLPVALRVGAKLPVGSSPLDGEIIPLGEGQWDVEAHLQAGYSFWPAPLYALTWVGYRARFANRTKQKDPGGEFLLLGEVGANVSDRWLVKATLDGFWGRGWVVEGLRVPNAARRLVNLQLGTGARVVGPFWLEGAVRLPLGGRNVPAGVQWVVGASATVSP